MSKLRLIALVSIATPVTLMALGVIPWLYALLVAPALAMVLFGIVAMSTILDKNEHEYKFAVGLLSSGFGLWLLYIALFTL